MLNNKPKLSALAQGEETVTDESSLNSSPADWTPEDEREFMNLHFQMED